MTSCTCTPYQLREVGCDCAPIWTVTGRVWNAETREHDKLQSIDFEREVDRDRISELTKTRERTI